MILTLEYAVSVDEKKADANNNKTSNMSRAIPKPQFFIKNSELKNAIKHMRGTKKHHLCPSFWSEYIISN